MTFRTVLSPLRASFAATAVAGATVLAACGGAPANDAAALVPAASSTSSPSSSSSSPSSTAPSPSSTTSSSTTNSPRSTAVKAPKKTTSRSATRPKPVVALVTTTVRLAPHTVRKTDSSLTKGKTSVLRAGTSGTQQVTIRRTTLAHRVTNTAVVKRVTLKKAVNRIVAVGTKAPVVKTPSPTRGGGSSTGLDLRRSGMWNHIAACESGGNWSINTGNGYYGGLQFNAQTWLANGGGRFAARADLASKGQQITIANHLYNRAGGSPWGCA